MLVLILVTNIKASNSDATHKTATIVKPHSAQAPITIIKQIFFHTECKRSNPLLILIGRWWNSKRRLPFFNNRFHFL